MVIKDVLPAKPLIHRPALDSRCFATRSPREAMFPADKKCPLVAEVVPKFSNPKGCVSEEVFQLIQDLNFPTKRFAAARFVSNPGANEK